MPKPWTGTTDVDRVTVELSQDWFLFMGRAPPSEPWAPAVSKLLCATIAFAQGTPALTDRANHLLTEFFWSRTASTSSPYFSSFDGPMPLIRSIPVRSDG